MGERYRREMLAHGGAKEPLLMVEGNLDSFFSPTLCVCVWGGSFSHNLSTLLKETLYFMTSFPLLFISLPVSFGLGDLSTVGPKAHIFAPLLQSFELQVLSY